ncbi:MAG: 30S ribosomal protein S16 [Gammaproteobacteria bacterium]
MVSIRLSRGGAKKRPFYHIVVTDQRNRRDGRYIERLGFFNPVAKGKEVKLRIDVDRVDHWLGNGARASERVSSLLKSYRKGAFDREVEAQAEAKTAKEGGTTAGAEAEVKAEAEAEAATKGKTAKEARADAEVDSNSEDPAGDAETDTATKQDATG